MNTSSPPRKRNFRFSCAKTWHFSDYSGIVVYMELFFSPDYSKHLPIEGDPGSTLTAARDQFLNVGFALSDQGAGFIEVTGSGMTSSKQNPLLGVSRARVSVTFSEITLEAQLGGARFLMGFAVLFPSGLILGLAAIFWFTLPNGREWATNTAPWMIALWLVLGPAMAWWIRQRSIRALDTLLNNARMIGATPPPPQHPV
jgi:hypothetical protein